MSCSLIVNLVAKLSLTLHSVTLEYPVEIGDISSRHCQDIKVDTQPSCINKYRRNLMSIHISSNPTPLSNLLSLTIDNTRIYALTYTLT